MYIYIYTGEDFTFTNRTFNPKVDPNDNTRLVPIRIRSDNEWEGLEESLTLNIIYYVYTGDEHHLFRTVYIIDRDGKCTYMYT